MEVYFDNAATTKMDVEVFESMKPFFLESFGNPSSTHKFGREAKAAVELARKNIAKLLNVQASEIYFTSGGTEAINTLLYGLTRDSKKTIISSPIEHHAVLNSLQALEMRGHEIKSVKLLENGCFDLDDLESMAKINNGAIISLMHVNNEIGTIGDVNEINRIAKENDCVYVADTVQSIGHLDINLQNGPDAVIASAHKFQGPKGSGFYYLRKGLSAESLIKGGGQEKGSRAGTENVAGIVGMAKALELSFQDRDEENEHLHSLKNELYEGLKSRIPDIEVNGDDIEKSAPHILSISFPPTKKKDVMLFTLDLKNIAVSGGSACGSGALKGSHVIEAIGVDDDKPVIRFSFSRDNSVKEVRYVIDSLSEIYQS